MWKKTPDDGRALTQPIPAGWQITDLGLLGQGGMSRVYRVRDDGHSEYRSLCSGFGGNGDAGTARQLVQVGAWL